MNLIEERSTHNKLLKRLFIWEERSSLKLSTQILTDYVLPMFHRCLREERSSLKQILKRFSAKGGTVKQHTTFVHNIREERSSLNLFNSNSYFKCFSFVLNVSN